MFIVRASVYVLCNDLLINNWTQSPLYRPPTDIATERTAQHSSSSLLLCILCLTLAVPSPICLSVCLSVSPLSHPPPPSLARTHARTHARKQSLSSSPPLPLSFSPLSLPPTPCTHAHMHIRTYVCTYGPIQTYVRMLWCMRTCIRIHTYTHTYMRANVHTFTHSQTYTQCHACIRRHPYRPTYAVVFTSFVRSK